MVGGERRAREREKPRPFPPIRRAQFGHVTEAIPFCPAALRLLCFDVSPSIEVQVEWSLGTPPADGKDLPHFVERNTLSHNGLCC